MDNNEHPVQIVSGSRQEKKNEELRIKKSQNSLFVLLGPAFSFICLLNQALKLRIYNRLVSPVLRSGLSSLVVKNTMLNPLPKMFSLYSTLCGETLI